MSETIVEKIRSDAGVIAASTLEEGGKKASEILDSAKNDVRIYKEKILAETSALRDEIVRRRISVANSEVKKLVLAAKKEKLDEVYASVLDKLTTLPKDKYLAIITAMLSYAEDGDKVVICKRDSAVITPEFIASVSKKRNIKLTLADTYADICGGIILSGEYLDKNLSFETEMSLLREDTESTVAKELFGEF